MTPTETDCPTPAASLFRRLAALIYDLFLLFAIAMGYGALLLALKMVITGSEDSQFALPVQLLASAGLLWALASYYHICWRKQGQTLGMKAWRIRAQQADGSLLSWKQCWIRSLLAPLSLAAGGLGYLYCLIPPRHACVHDIFSHSEVVLIPKERKRK